MFQLNDLPMMTFFNWVYPCHMAGKQFYAHKICLVAYSDIFRAMFDGLYKVSFWITIVVAYLSS